MTKPLIKSEPRGRPFPKGKCMHRNAGGRPFVKLTQKLSVVAANALSEAAPDEDCLLVGLPAGSAKARVIVEACYRAALAGDVAAARALFEFTEAAKVRVEQLNVDVGLFTQARDVLLKAMQKQLPAEAER